MSLLQRIWTQREERKLASAIRLQRLWRRRANSQRMLPQTLHAVAEQRRMLWQAKEAEHYIDAVETEARRGMLGSAAKVLGF